MGAARSRTRPPCCAVVNEVASELEPYLLAGPPGPPLSDLCDDVLLEIASRCGVREIGRLRQTCRRLENLLGERSALLWARKAAESFGPLDGRWKSLARASRGSAPRGAASEFSSVEVGVWSCGVNQGPIDWGVPTPPPFQSTGQMGLPELATDTRVRRPTLLPTLRGRGKSQPTDIACGGYHTVFLMSDGTAWSCGTGVFGQTGRGARDPTDVPAPMATPRGHAVSSVHCGFAFTLLRTAAGKVLACGFNQNGRLGISDARCAAVKAARTDDGDYLVLSPTEIDALPAGARVASLACGSGHALALLDDGSVMSWGRGEQGQLGTEAGAPATSLGSFSVRVDHSPEQYKARRVKGLPPVKAVACGSYFSAALTRDGRVFVWGGINGWRLPTPVELSLPEPVAKLHCSSMLLIMVPKSGCVFLLESQRDELLAALAGRSEANEEVAAGDRLAAIGTRVWRVPLPIGSEGTHVRDVAADGYAVLVLLSSGRVLLWGFTGTRQIHPDFYAVLPAQPTNRVCKIALGCEHFTCIALHTDGAIGSHLQDRYTLWPVLPAAPLF